MTDFIISAKNIVRTFRNNTVETRVLKGIDINIKRAEFVAIMGRSGAGKSTLLYQLSLLDHPDNGEIFIDGVNARELSTDKETLFRLERFGFVFQDYAVLPELTALENVMLPLLMQGKSDAEAAEAAKEALHSVELEDRANNLPSQLSGGQQQRVSIARAIGHKPAILFADEPTANLDQEGGRAVIDIFKRLHESGQTIVMVTHEEEYVRDVDRVIRLSDGMIASD